MLDRTILGILLHVTGYMVAICCAQECLLSIFIRNTFILFGKKIEQEGIYLRYII